jgi:hypothetical protein
MGGGGKSNANTLYHGYQCLLAVVAVAIQGLDAQAKPPLYFVITPAGQSAPPLEVLLAVPFHNGLMTLRLTHRHLA